MSSSRSTGSSLVTWGVRVGEVVYVASSGPRAFRREADLRARRIAAQVVVCVEGVWVPVSAGSAMRADPAPAGPRRVGWLERWRRSVGFRPSDGR